PRTNLVPREEVPVTVILANEDQLEITADLSLQVVGPTNQVLWKKKRSLKLPRHGRELWEGTVGASGSTGTHKFIVRLMQGMKCLAENSTDLYVYDPVEPAGLDVHILDPQQTWTKRCAALATPSAVQAPLHIIPPLANTIRAYPDRLGPSPRAGQGRRRSNLLRAPRRLERPRGPRRPRFARDEQRRRWRVSRHVPLRQAAPRV
ncbi:MAG: hypothetical protein NTU83_07690, partial [Candidatus Hydrogenedentes bacterium]|nr:hypothetical protein [Candidatus Hydrogenedentota bacterium]